VNDVTFVRGSWKLQAATSLGILTEEGDLSSAGFTVIYGWPGTGRSATAYPDNRTRPPVLAIVWDQVSVPLLSDTGARLDISTYLALAPAEVESGVCGESGCRYWDTDADYTVASLGGRDIGDVVNYVDGR
jgi:hypothetical protein